MRRRELANPSLVEEYIRGGVMPRFMLRLREIAEETQAHRSRLERAYAELLRECGGDAGAFEERWRATARSWRFERVNELIHQHNEYYPIERALPVNPRTGDYLTVGGRSYRREPLGADWILERFPPRTRAGRARAS
jgi:hypothetical protein